MRLNSGQSQQGTKKKKAGSGTNAKGSSKKWTTGNKGFFQYGLGQFGYINPGGTINWNANAGKAQDANLMYGFGGINQHANKTGQMKGMPSQKAKPPVYMTPAALFNKTEDKRQFDIANARLAEQNKLDNVGYQRQLDAINSALSKQMPVIASNLAARGFDPSEGAGAGTVGNVIGEADEQAQEAKYGVGVLNKAYKANEAELIGNYKAANERLERAAKQAYKDEHDGKIPKLETGFKKINGKWFYTNKRGVTVSASAPPKKKKKKGK